MKHDGPGRITGHIQGACEGFGVGGGHQDHELKLKHRASMRLSVLQRKCRAIMQKATVRLTNHGQNRWGATKGLAKMVNGGPET